MHSTNITYIQESKYMEEQVLITFLTNPLINSNNTHCLFAREPRFLHCFIGCPDN